MNRSTLVVVGVDGPRELEGPQVVDGAGAIEVGSRETVAVCREGGNCRRYFEGVEASAVPRVPKPYRLVLAA